MPKQNSLNQPATKHDVQLVKHDVQLVKHDVQLVKHDVQLVKHDVQLVKQDVQLVKQELKQDMKGLEVRLEEKISNLPTKDEFFQKMDEVMGELQTIREEQTLTSHTLSDHEDRITTLEQSPKN